MGKKNFNKLPNSSYIINLFIILKFFYFQLLINSIKGQCHKNAPILVRYYCKLQYCSEKQFEKGECKIGNEIIKTQWLTKIIKIGELKFRYVNFAQYSNGSMVVETTACCPGNDKRMFYGLDIDGKGLFTSNDGSDRHIFIQ